MSNSPEELMMNRPPVKSTPSFTHLTCGFGAPNTVHTIVTFFLFTVIISCGGSVISGARANISIRGKNVRKLTLDAISGLEGARGGGHKDATGASLLVEDLPKFKERIETLLDLKK